MRINILFDTAYGCLTMAKTEPDLINEYGELFLILLHRAINITREPTSLRGMLGFAAVVPVALANTATYRTGKVVIAGRDIVGEQFDRKSEIANAASDLTPVCLRTADGLPRCT